jgi:CDP-diacylglycerol--glycerol-3-phosphate 3-phosphatidyltransferase
MKKSEIITIPNILTLIRLLAIPVLARLIYMGKPYDLLAFIFFLGIWLTDMLDGYIARRFNQVTEFGKLFDPFVDKLFQLTTAVMMYIVGKLPLWIPLLIAIKELAMIIGGLLLLRRFDKVVPSRWYGKLATVLFVAAFASLFFLPEEYYWLTNYIFILPLFFSLYSYVGYGLNYLKVRREKLAGQSRNE